MSRITKKYIHLSSAHISYLNSQIKTVYIWKTRRVSYKKQKLLTLHEHLSSSPVLFRWGQCNSPFFYYFVLSYYVS